jgi:hypothetical protein
MKAALPSGAVSATPLAGQVAALTQGQGFTMGPGTPMLPMASNEHDPRRFAYQPGRNLVATPRAYEPITFAVLRNLCATYDVARVAIEARKDEARGWEWDVRPRPLKGLTLDEQKARSAGFRDEVTRVTGFLMSPNQEDDFGTWLVQYLEDLFSIDAPTIYLRSTRGGDLYAAEIVDGSTIRVLIDDYGRLPTLGATAPIPTPHLHNWQQMADAIVCSVCNWPAAYGQVIFGVSRTYFPAYELVYEPYHQDPTSPYGSPPMEWVLMSVNRALRRQSLDLSNFTEGTLPISYYKLPEGWTPGQIEEMQQIFDTLLAGDDLARARVRFVPGGTGAGPERINPEPTTDVEKWLMHITAAAFGTSAFELGFEPSSGLGGAGFGESSRVSAEKRGSRPLAAHLKGILDRLIAGPLGAPDLEFRFRGLQAAQDQQAEAMAREIEWKSGAYSTDEWRDDKGFDPIGLGPTVFDPKVGVVLVSDLLAASSATASVEASSTTSLLDTGKPSPPATPSAAPGETTADAPIAPPAVKASRIDDLAKWRRKALNAVERGRNPARFDSDEIDDDTAGRLGALLAGATTAAQVRAAFEEIL